MDWDWRWRLAPWGGEKKKRFGGLYNIYFFCLSLRRLRCKKAVRVLLLYTKDCVENVFNQVRETVRKTSISLASHLNNINNSNRNGYILIHNKEQDKRLKEGVTKEERVLIIFDF